MNSYFVTGTDTGIGKTTVVQFLLRYYGVAGYATLGLKPVAAGCDKVNGELCNSDALLLQQGSRVKLPYAAINPITLHAACSPHIAAALEHKNLQARKIVAACQTGLSAGADYTFVEGAGGWYTPINNQETLADIAQQLQLPVLLVVGIRLGCLNHALLAISKSGLPLAGWVANCVDNTHAYASDDIATLLDKLPAPLWLTLKYGGDFTFMHLP